MTRSAEPEGASGNDRRTAAAGDPCGIGPRREACSVFRAVPRSANRFRFGLDQLLAGVAVLSALCLLWSMGVTSLHGGHARSGRNDCKNNLKQLGVYLVLYVSRYGGDVQYPTCSPPRGADDGPPHGPNGAFWSHLWRLPVARPTATGTGPRPVCQRPGEDALFACRVYRASMRTETSGLPRPSAVTLHYAGPDLGNGTCFPGGVLSERVLPATYIGGDLVIRGDANHGPDGINALRFDGSVRWIEPAAGPAAEWNAYLDATNGEDGVRTW